MATVVFFPEGAFGPTNNCVGIGDVLRARGHRVVFIVEESFAGTLEARGFEERLMRLGPPPEVEEAPGQFWKDFIRDTAPVFRKPTIEQLGEFIAADLAGAGRRRALRRRRASRRSSTSSSPTSSARTTSRLPGHPGLRAALGAHRLLQPARGERPGIPPVFSGYAADDRTGWDEFRGRARPHPPPACTPSSTSSARRRRAGAARPGVHPRLAVSQPLRLSRGARLPPRAAARRHLAPARVVRARRRTPTSRSRPRCATARAR